MDTIESQKSDFTVAKWIWCSEQECHEYNAAARFKKNFNVETVKQGQLKITADSWYRVSVNGTWLGDGPAKAYPEHWIYDSYDIAELLVEGDNVIEVIARYYGVGTFHQIPREAGFLAELEVNGECIGTDATWQAAPYRQFRQWSPKVSIQMEPAESIDARIADADWQPAVELHPADNGVLKDLTESTTEPLTKDSSKPTAVYGTYVVAQQPSRVCVPVTRIAHPGTIEANHYTSRPVILASVLSLETAQTLDLSSGAWTVAINGEEVDGSISLDAGRHTAVFCCHEFYGHNKELGFPFVSMPDVVWEEWHLYVHDQFQFADNDHIWFWFKHAQADEVQDQWRTEVEKMCKQWSSADERVPCFGRIINLAEEHIFLEDFTAEFAARSVEQGVEPSIDNAEAVCKGNSGAVTIDPVAGKDVEICYDLGDQYCGFFDFDITAPAGTIVDLHLVEYIRPDGVVQHTDEYNRNGMRYVCEDGVNTHTSLKRRSGRYMFVTLRGMTEQVTINSLTMIESTADVTPVEEFSCSDDRLTQIWSMCERTLRMCMEDVFTDCPLYEQTLWIGDARNESIYSFLVYGDEKISARSLVLGAESLEHFPIVGCQVPSAWETILPAWSFLWGIHVWEHYFNSGDKELLKQLWPAVQKNIEGSYNYINEDGLFSSDMWNLLEWAPIDHEQETVIHNNILLVGALRAAINCANELGEKGAAKDLQKRLEQLILDVNKCWDTTKNTYPDAILEDGSASEKVCQHNSALSIMCDVLPEEYHDAARKNLIDPPEAMTKIGSPFAGQFHLEALLKLGEYDAIMESIYTNYLPMIEVGSTTVWETFPGSTCSPDGFPTRSHCHGWSCAPLQFISRIVLGIEQTAIGGSVFTVSPWVNGLENAQGSVATPHGPIQVKWQRNGDAVTVNISKPAAVEIVFKDNASHDGLNVDVTVG